MNLSVQGLRRLATVTAVAALLAVAGCNDGPEGPPDIERPEMPTLKMTATDVP